MALKKRLAAGWYLTDGILNPFPVGEKTDVLSAAVESGHAPDPLVGLNLMRGEWIYARKWSYVSSFDAPTEGDERVSLLFDELGGDGEVFVNGRSAGRFSSGEARLDITGLVIEGENQLKVCFEPSAHFLPSADPMPPFGLIGPAWLLTSNFVTLESVKSRVTGDEIIVEIDVTAHTAGKYLFSYLVSVDGELLIKKEFVEKLPAARVLKKHVLTIENRPTFDPKRRDETVCDVRLSVERSNLGCEDVRFEAAFVDQKEKREKRVLLLRGGALTEEIALRMLELGAGAVCAARYDGQRRVQGDFQFGLRLLETCGEPFHENAVIAPETLLREAGEATFWPAQTPLWRLRGGEAPDFSALEKKYGEGMSADYERAVRLSRYEQAERAMTFAETCRMSGKECVFAWDMPWDSLSGDALTERGTDRPALAALRLAWSKTHACARIPEDGAEGGTLVSIPVCAMNDGENGLMNVSASVYRMDGSLLVGGSYPAMLDGARQVGVLTLNVPETEQVLIVRCEMTGADNALLCRVDQLLCVRGQAPMSALLNPNRAVLSTNGNRRINIGECAALSAGYALLPGEETDQAIEWLNV